MKKKEKRNVERKRKEMESLRNLEQQQKTKKILMYPNIKNITKSEIEFDTCCNMQSEYTFVIFKHSLSSQPYTREMIFFNEIDDDFKGNFKNEQFGSFIFEPYDGFWTIGNLRNGKTKRYSNIYDFDLLFNIFYEDLKELR